jgi:hypothetical protein
VKIGGREGRAEKKRFNHDNGSNLSPLNYLSYIILINISVLIG